MNERRNSGRAPTEETANLNGQLDGIVNQLAGTGVTLEQARGIFERKFILATLKLNGGNISRSAEALGLHRNTLRKKFGPLGIQTTDYRTLGKRIQAR